MLIHDYREEIFATAKATIANTIPGACFRVLADEAGFAIYIRDKSSPKTWACIGAYLFIVGPQRVDLFRLVLADNAIEQSPLGFAMFISEPMMAKLFKDFRAALAAAVAVPS